ncbi:hypothetical protein EJ05DRAFT_471681 [Pseudovirgaria hyperparasitica]|uniref:Uncharacterized protein n=1 Tax=Pseudovirgaria hyperparasitica TaxID=470096 RepID=A0A6A6WKP3_9PEZI|nr:uncharacterized protein EJ05DRAFT_471681 [Pseudovirgaria hyperparasitica]KAF2762731.1 hypothetical protein EJ05DRAFT_471681 [Pseudovirgaria hyperparasitica]
MSNCNCDNNALSAGLTFFPPLRELQLDIVGFLAILGEGSILANAQVSSLSKWMFVPRLLPAPQALMRPTRPSRLQQSQGFVTAVHSGNSASAINHIGNLVLDAESMDAFSVRCVSIVRDPNKPDVKAKTAAPLTVVAGFGCILSIALLALAIWQGDGCAMLADILLSFLSTLIGFGNKWSLQLPKRKQVHGKVPPGDVVIRYPKGSFLVVQCSEDVARELYFAPETIDYWIQKPPVYRLLSLVGTTMLMFGVIFLGNSTPQLQIGFAAAYMILNAAYWIVAALPAKMHWNTSTFRIKQHRFADSSPDAEEDKRFASKSKTFTQALWKVIVVTKSWDWVRRGGAAPQTAAWDEWLHDATVAAKTTDSFKDERGIINWQIPDHFDPQVHLVDLISKHENQGKTTSYQVRQ